MLTECALQSWLCGFLTFCVHLTLRPLGSREGASVWLFTSQRPLEVGTMKYPRFCRWSRCQVG